MDLSTTIHLLGETLGDVLRTQESVALFEVEERIRTLAKTRRGGDPVAGARLAAEVARLPDDAARVTASLRAEVAPLWLTDRARTARPAVTDEVRTGLYFVDAIFWDALPRIAADLEGALREHYPTLAAPPGWLGLASWIGGDRDGNSSVTAAVTAETLRLHRGLAVERHRRSLQELARRVSVSGRPVPPPPRFPACLE